MVTYYYEIFETRDIDENNQNPIQRTLTYVADKAEAEALHESEKVKYEGLSYKARFVTCNHDEGEPCTEEIIEEV